MTKFDATQIEPNQGGKSHPVGKFPATISNTQVVANKEKTGGMFRVTFSTSGGSIDSNYNLWHTSEQAVKISRGQLSALCHATGVFQLDFPGGSEGAELRGKQCMIDVTPQMIVENGNTIPNPKGWTEVSKVYDIQGHEPGRGPAQPQGGSQGWGATQQQPSPNPAPAPSQAWQAGPQQTAQAANPAPNAGWAQGPAAQGPGATPPWGKQ